MKLIEALKKIKDLQRKAEDLRGKVEANSAYLDYETPPYDDPRAQVVEWIQAHSDILKKILELRVAIQRTNLAVSVTIELDGKSVTKSIAEWIHRRRDLAGLDLAMWQKLTDRGLREGTIQQSTGEAKDVHIVRNFDARERDMRQEVYTSEPMEIDARLEIVNATAEVIEE